MIRLFLLAILLAGFNQVYAQRIRSREGDPGILKAVTRMNVVFSYDGLTLTNRHTPEADFVEENVSRLNEKKAGKGLEWKYAWLQDREQKLEPQFITAFDQATGIQLGHYPRATYTLIFHTTHMETGHNIRISRKSAYIDGEASVVETDHPEHVICKIRFTDCKGKGFDGYDFAANLRLMESYATAGEAVGRFVGMR